MEVDSLKVDELPVDSVILVYADKDIVPVEYKMVVAIDSYFCKKKCVVLSVIDSIDGEFVVGEFFVKSLALDKDVNCIPVPVKDDQGFIRIGQRQLLEKVTKIDCYLPFSPEGKKAS